MYFFFNDTETTEIYTYVHTLSLHDALPISTPQEIEAVIVLNGEAVDPFDEKTLGHIRIGALGLAGRRSIEPGLAADALLHHRERAIIDLVARRPHELVLPQFGSILADDIAYALPLHDYAHLVH